VTDVRTFGERGEKFPKDYKRARKSRIVLRCVQMAEPFRVESVDGYEYGKPGDWLMEGPQGYLYLCRDEQFRKVYEIVDDESGDDANF
jgi:hypothetical protein